MKILLLITTVFIMHTKLISQQISFNDMKPYIEVFQEKLSIPNGYHFHSVKKVMADKVSAYLFRYQKNGEQLISEEHFSFIISEKEKQILGFTYMDTKYATQKMISKEQTKAIAIEFLVKVDSTLAINVRNLWIAQHDEKIVVNGKPLTISGMKYKCHREIKDDYAWVIVGFDGSIITFERNIKWNYRDKIRITEKWLHDSWISE